MKKISTTQGSAGLAQFFLWKSKSAGQTPYTLTNISVRSNRTWLWEKLAVFSPSLPFCGHIFFQQNHKVLTSIFITLSHRHIVVNFPPHYFSLQLRICSWTSQKKILTVVWRYHLNFSLIFIILSQSIISDKIVNADDVEIIIWNFVFVVKIMVSTAADKSAPSISGDEGEVMIKCPENFSLWIPNSMTQKLDVSYFFEEIIGKFENSEYKLEIGLILK